MVGCDYASHIVICDYKKIEHMAEHLYRVTTLYILKGSKALSFTDSSHYVGGSASGQSLDERNKEGDSLFAVSFSCAFKLIPCIYIHTNKI